jgi:hypothetical protein
MPVARSHEWLIVCWSCNEGWRLSGESVLQEQRQADRSQTSPRDNKRPDHHPCRQQDRADYIEGIQFYRRRSPNEPWEKVGTPVNLHELTETPPYQEWPFSRSSSVSNPSGIVWVALFDVDPSVYCGTPYYYAIRTVRVSQT